MEKKYQIFICSTYEDLKEAKRKVQDAILSMYHFPVGMELFGAADEEQWKIIRETIESSDYRSVLSNALRTGVLREVWPENTKLTCCYNYNDNHQQKYNMTKHLADIAGLRLEG